jgi:hypothetical protein
MPTPTTTEAINTLKAALNELQHLDRFANALSPNLIGLEDTLVNSLAGDAAGAILSNAAQVRSAVAGQLTPGRDRATMTPCFNDFMAAILIPSGSLAQNLIEFRQWMINNIQTINSRDMTYSAITVGGSNVGTGTISRITVDGDNLTLEGAHAELKTFTCIADQGQTDETEEVFRLEGANAGADFASGSTGSGIITTMRAFSARDSQSFVRNPSWSSFSGTQPTAGAEVAPTVVTSWSGWTVGDITKCKASVDQVYRGFPGDTTPMSIRLIDNTTCSQVFRDQVNPSFPARTPFYVQVAVYREANCDGTLTITLGSKTQAVTMSGLSNGAWNVVRLDLDRDLYYDRWRLNDATIGFALTSRTTGTLYLDDIIFSPFNLLDGIGYSIVGSATPFMRDDTFSFTDTQSATRGVLQWWLTHRSRASELVGYPFTLPAATGGSETIADPA